MIGMDSEWRPVMSRVEATRPALLQLSDETTAFLIDLVALANNPVLDHVLTEIFTNPDSLCLGFSFKSDLEIFSRHFPQMNFYRRIANFLDVQTYFARVCAMASQCGLAKVTQHIHQVKLCKGEQMSNWERRPLRLTQ